MAMAKKKNSRSPGLTLKLDAAIYARPALDQACRAYSHLARIVVQRQGRFQVVRFSEVKPAVVKHLADEFANYALSCLLVQR